MSCTIYSLSGFTLVKRFIQDACPNVTGGGGTKRAIEKFSAQSSASMRRYLGGCVADYGYIGTLTYPEDYPRDGKVAKKHLRAFIHWYLRQSNKRRRLDEQGESLFWFMEFQARGAPHFHYFVTRMARNTISELREAIAIKWYEIVGSGDENHLKAGTQFDKFRTGRGGTMVYASKYARKAEQKDVPVDYINCGRFWGVSGLRLTLSADIAITAQDMRLRSVHIAVNKFENWLKHSSSEDFKARIDGNGELKGVYIKNIQGKIAIKRRMASIENILLTERQVRYVWAFEEPYDIMEDNSEHGLW